MPDPIVVPLHSHRQQRAALAQKLQHAIPGVVLLLAGLQTLSEGPHGVGLALAVFQIAASVLLLGHTARTVHASRHLLRRTHPPAHPAHPAHHGIEWADIFAAVVVIAEGLERKMHGHHFPRPIYLTATVLIVLGLFHGRLMRMAEGRRALRVSDDGLSLGGRPFKARKINATWAQLKSIEVGARYAVITTRFGRTRKLDLSDLEGADHVRHALAEAQRRLESYGGPETEERSIAE